MTENPLEGFDDLLDFLSNLPERPAGLPTRPDKETVTKFLEGPLTVHELIEDEDGPVGMTNHVAARCPSLEHLGWTQVEYDDPTIQE